MEDVWSEISNICRFCLCESVEILLPANKIIDCPSAVEDVERFTGIRIVEEKNTSYSICEDCGSKLKNFSAFRSFCLHNDTLFRQWFPMVFENVSSDTEPEQQEKQEASQQLDRYHLDKSRKEITDHIGYIASYDEPSLEDDAMKIEYLDIDDSVAVGSINDNSDSGSVSDGDLEIDEVEVKEDLKVESAQEIGDDTVEENEEQSVNDQTIGHDSSHSFEQHEESQDSASTSNSTQSESENSAQKVSKKQLCPICGKMVYDVSDHKLSHSNERKYACPHCSMAYGRKAYLNFHVRSVHQKKVVRTCEICNRGFAYKTGYDAHMRALHNVGKWYECKPCNMKYRHPGGLRNHKNRKHNDESNCECPECGMVFQDKIGLSNHSRVHSTEKMFACKYCHKRFRSPNAHRGHMLTHLGITFPCPHCPKSYRYKQNLKIHMAKHYT